MEVWKSVPDYPDYQVSSFGNVRSHKYVSEGKLICNLINSTTGYNFVNLYDKDRRLCINTHSLIAKVFLPNPDNLPEIDHIDGNRQNNRLDNLEWVTRRENMMRRKNIKLSITGEKYITLTKEKSYRVSIRGENNIRVYDKTYKTLPEAIEARNKYLAENKI